jgi:hypothetical protein
MSRRFAAAAAAAVVGVVAAKFSKLDQERNAERCPSRNESICLFIGLLKLTPQQAKEYALPKWMPLLQC